MDDQAKVLQPQAYCALWPNTMGSSPDCFVYSHLYLGVQAAILLFQDDRPMLPYGAAFAHAHFLHLHLNHAQAAILLPHYYHFL